MQPAELGFFELISSDLERSKQFYGKLFGWKFRETVSKEFVMIEGAGVPGGMILDCSPVCGRPNAKLFFKVEALETTLSLAQELGGSIVIPPAAVSPTSMIAEFADDDNNVIGMICARPVSR